MSVKFRSDQVKEKTIIMNIRSFEILFLFQVRQTQTFDLLNDWIIPILIDFSCKNFGHHAVEFKQHEIW